ncbi:helix-turn-helix domain-containing protein [Cereibacter sp. SYSU M97828]|nr:helix-turn-helix domain-containing protein [Cereibacter flavus]
MGKQDRIGMTALPERVEAAPRVIAYVSIGLLCELLDISPSTAWDWVKRGHLPKPVKIGGTARWKWADVEKKLQTGDANRIEDDDPILRASRGG